MADNYTPRLRLVEQEVGANDGQWGGILNAQLARLTDDAIAGLASISLAGGDVTLSVANGAADQARMPVLEFYGATADATVTVPAINKLYLVRVVQDTFTVTLAAGGTDLVVQPQTAVSVHVSAAGDVQAVSVPSTLGSGAGGISVSGRFTTLAFEDVGDLNGNLLRLGDTNGVEINAGGTDKPLAVKTKEGVTVLHVNTDDTTGSNVSLVSFGGANTDVKILSTLVLSPASKAAVIETEDDDGTLLIRASDDASDGSAIAIYGDANTVDLSKRGYIELIGTAGALSPKLLVNGFSGGVEVDGEKVWTAGNDGNGSGLDADLLGGHDHNDYLRLTRTSVTQVAEGKVEFQDRAEFTATSGGTIRLDSTAPMVQYYERDGQGAIKTRWKLGANSDDFQLVYGTGDTVALYYRRSDDKLFRGSPNDGDEFLSKQSDFFGEDTGSKGCLTVGGLLVQYGEVTVSGNTHATVTFAKEFPTAARSVVATQEGSNKNDPNFTVEVIDTRNFRVHNFTSSSKSVYWMAMGD